MSQLAAAFGRNSAQRLARLTAGHEAVESDTTDPTAAFALIHEPRDAYSEHCTLFATPDGSTRGVLSGRLFNLDEVVREAPEGLPFPQRLAVALETLHRRHGADFPLALDGAFGMALRIGGQLLVVRDAIGERSLYRMAVPGGVLTSSSLAPLLAHPECEKKLNLAALHDYLCSGFFPFARTPIQNIEKILPGHLSRIDNGASEEIAYHRLTDAVIDTAPEPEQVQRTRQILEAAAAKRRIDGASAVLLLSGGFDSSMVGALVGRESLRAAYSISFGNGYPNELAFSSLMARQLSLPQRIVTITPRMVEEGLADTMRALDEPIGDALTVPNWVVAREMAREAQVVFNGEGGDPLYGGPKNLPMLAAEALGGQRAGRRGEDYVVSYKKGSQYLAEIMTPDFWDQAVAKTTNPSEHLFGQMLEAPQMSRLLNKLMHTNLRLKGAAQILPKVGKIASFHGYAVCSPLFDRHLTEMSFRTPPGLKLNGTREKHILKEAVRGLVPAEIIARRKSGMRVPVTLWLRNELNPFARETLLSRRSLDRGLYQRDPLERVLDFRASGFRAYPANRIWLMLSLEAWFQVHGL